MIICIHKQKQLNQLQNLTNYKNKLIFATAVTLVKVKGIQPLAICDVVKMFYRVKEIQMRYDYLEAVKNDIVNYIQENINLSEYTREDLEEKLNEDLWTCDSVTGNASGSYTFNREEAKNNLAGNGDLVREAFEEFGEKEKAAN